MKWHLKEGTLCSIIQEGQPITYASRALVEIEQWYFNIERELLAVVYTLKWCNHFTYGYRVWVETDHKPMISIWKKSIAASNPRLQWLLLRQSQYNVHKNYLQGKANVIANAFSWVSPLTIESNVYTHLNIIHIQHITNIAAVSPTKLQGLWTATCQDRVLSSLMQAVYHRWPESCKCCNPDTIEFWNNRNEISLKDGLLFKGNRLIIPQTEWQKPLWVLHLGHYGIEKMSQ